MTICEIITDAYEYPSRYISTDYNDIRTDSENVSSNLPSFISISELEHLLGYIEYKGVKVYDVTILLHDVDMTDVTQDVYIHFTNVYELIDFTDILKQYVKEISIHIIRDTTGIVHYYVTLMQTIANGHYMEHNYSINVNIANLTYKQAKMLEVFFNRIANDGKIGHSETCALFCDGDGDFRPRIDIVNNFEDDDPVATIDSISQYNGDNKNHEFTISTYKGDFYLTDRSFDTDYLPLYLMHIYYNNTNNINNTIKV